MGSEGSAAGGGHSDPSEWPWSVGDVAALSARRTPGTATGSAPAYRGPLQCSFINPGVAQLVARLLWELEHSSGSTASNVAYFPLALQLPLITSVESWAKMW